MIIQDKENQVIRQFLQSKEWTSVEKVLERIMQDYQQQSSVRNNAEETLRATYLKEGAMQGIQRIKQELFLMAE